MNGMAPGRVELARLQRAVTVVGGRAHRQLLDVDGGARAPVPAQVDVRQQPRQDHRHRLVAQRRGAEILNHLGRRQRRQQAAVARQRRRGAGARDLTPAAFAVARQQQPEVVHHHQRHPQPESRQHVPPGGSGDRLHGAGRMNVRKGQRRQLPSELVLGEIRLGGHPTSVVHRSRKITNAGACTGIVAPGEGTVPPPWTDDAVARRCRLLVRRRSWGGDGLNVG